jgi:hypothetical protein
MNFEISGIELTVINAKERLGMGGPYTGDVFIKNKLISIDCLMNNFVYQENTKLLFFVKYHHINHYQYFTINSYNLINDSLYEFYREFSMVYIKQFLTANELEIFLAFHDKLIDRKQIFNLDEEDFQQI